MKGQRDNHVLRGEGWIFKVCLLITQQNSYLNEMKESSLFLSLAARVPADVVFVPV